MRYQTAYESRLGATTPDEVFDYLMATFINSIKGWDYWVNWEGVFGKIQDIEIDLNTLNYLVGKADTRGALADLLRANPRLVRLIPILLATRDDRFEILHDYAEGKPLFGRYSFEVSDAPLDEVAIASICDFAEGTGLLSLFRHSAMTSVPTYVLGVEVGIDTNTRKNRTGKAMETLVEQILKPICTQLNLPYLNQATPRRIEAAWGISVKVDKSSRAFDFAIRQGERLTMIEVNFYGGGGSKLKATAGEYRTLFAKLQEQHHSFIWITDGAGWHNTRDPLREAFDDIDTIINLRMASSGLLMDMLSWQT